MQSGADGVRTREVNNRTDVHSIRSRIHDRNDVKNADELNSALNISLQSLSRDARSVVRPRNVDS